jgi:UDP-GlcNAc:undecaprenyl-phosphate/decaprenyl-phosphate GlcNAc-1-phosphate transferase
MSSLQWLAVSVAPAMVAWLVIAALFKSPVAARLADRPNERSLHEVPTPRIGGLGIMVGAMPMAIAYASFGTLGIAGTAIFLCIVSLADDVRSLPVQVRLLAHFIAAAVAVYVASGGEPAGANLVESIVAVFAIVWMTNLYNFMDGSDGLAGGMTTIGFGALAIAAALAGQYPLAAACAALASASLGFLAYNFPPARVFMGDAGSVPLGFLAGALGYAGWMKGAWPLFFPVAVFAPFIVDATLTLARRVIKGEPFWKAHRTHGYQRLVLAGWSRPRLAGSAYVLMLASAGAAFSAKATEGPVRLGILLLLTAAYALLVIAIEARVRTS